MQDILIQKDTTLVFVAFTLYKLILFDHICRLEKQVREAQFFGSRLF